MAFVGLVPSEHSSGARVRRGAITRGPFARFRPLAARCEAVEWDRPLVSC